MLVIRYLLTGLAGVCCVCSQRLYLCLILIPTETTSTILIDTALVCHW